MVSIESVLQTGWPRETDIVGSATVSHIAQGVDNGIPQSELFRAESGGGDLAFHEIVTDLMAAAVATKAAIEIVQIFVKTHGHKPTEADVTTELAKRKLSYANEVVQKVMKALKSLGNIV